MRVFRIARRPFARSPLDGRGGLFASGRWHTPRRFVIYTSGSLALASLEVLVHCDIDLVPRDLVAIEIVIPDDVKIRTMALSRLPRDWRKYPAPNALQMLGNSWLDEATTCVLRVPSVVIPTEHNFLMNPSHTDAKRIKVARKFSSASIRASFQAD